MEGQADDPRMGEPAHTYHPVRCSACGGSHLVDPATGETWSDGIEGLLDEEEEDLQETVDGASHQVHLAALGRNNSALFPERCR